MAEWYVDGVNLDHASGWWQVSGDTMPPVPAAQRTASLELPQRPGEITKRLGWDAGQARVVVNVFGDDDAETEGRARYLRGLLGRGRKLAFGSDRVREVDIKRAVVSEPVRLAPTMQRLIVEYRLAPFWVEVAGVVHALVDDGAGPGLLVGSGAGGPSLKDVGGDLWWTGDSDPTADLGIMMVGGLPWVVSTVGVGAPVTSAQQTALSPAVFGEWAGCTGDLAEGILRVRGPLTRASIVASDGSGVSFERSLSSSQYVFINLATFEAWHGSSSAWEPTSTAVLLDYPPAGPLRVSPEFEGVVLSMSGDGFTAGTTGLRLRAHKYWL